MNEEVRSNIIEEICSVVERNPGLLKMWESLDRLFRDVEKMKELIKITSASQQNHYVKLQEFVETMVFSLSEINAKSVLEQKLQEQAESMKQKEEKLREVEAAYTEIAATRTNEQNGLRCEMEHKNELLLEIRNGLASFCDLPKAKRWQLILNEDSIISHLKGLAKKIDAVIGDK